MFDFDFGSIVAVFTMLFPVSSLARSTHNVDRKITCRVLEVR